jgi:ACS family hexuronate transporter-like MFS transporter
MNELNAKYSNYRWVILFVLFLATAVVYYNRMVYSLTAVQLEEHLGIGAKEYGYGVTAFQFTYMIGFLLAGWVVDKLGSRIGLALSMLLWSLASGLTALSGGVLSLCIFRGILGLIQAAHFPSAIKIVAEWFPQKQRSLATTLFNSGPSIAIMTSGVIIVWIISAKGLNLNWRFAYYFFAATGVVLSIVWLLIYKPNKVKDDSDQDASVPAKKVRWSHLLVARESWGIMVCKFCGDPVWWFYMAWLPLYLIKERGIDFKAVAWALPVIYGSSILFSNVAGWITGKLIDKGVNPIKARKTMMLVCALCMPVTALAGFTGNTIAIIALVSLACAAHCGWSANNFTLVSDCFKKETVGSMTGLAGFAGGVGGVLITGIVPTVLIESFGYSPIFILMGILHPIAFVVMNLLIKRDGVEKVEL